MVSPSNEPLSSLTMRLDSLPTFPSIEETDDGGSASVFSNNNEEEDDHCDDRMREFIMQAIDCADEEETLISTAVAISSAGSSEECSRYNTLPPSDEQQHEEHTVRHNDANSRKKQLLQNRRLRKKKKKEQGHPKRPISSYNYFFQQERPMVMAEYPDSSFGDIARIIGQRWGRLNPRRKAALDRLYQMDSLRYRREVDLSRRQREQAMKDVAYLRQCDYDDVEGGSFTTVPATPTTLHRERQPEQQQDHHYQHHHRHLETPFQPLPRSCSPPGRSPHEIPPSPTAVAHPQHTTNSMTGGRESAPIEANLWEKPRDNTPFYKKMAVSGLAAADELYRLSSTKTTTTTNDETDQQHQQQYNPSTSMMEYYQHDGYNGAVPVMTYSSSATVTPQHQLVVPNATVNLHNPLTGVMECYRVDYRSYVMTQTDAKEFLRRYGCGDDNNNNKVEEGDKVKLEKIWTSGLQQSPSGRIVSS